MSTALVTGALGFLGRHIAAELAAGGFRVIGLGREEPPADSRALGLAAYSQVNLPSVELATLLDAERPDLVVHAAGPASVGDSILTPVDDFSGTVGMLLGVLDSVRAVLPAARVIALSSAAVYGNPKHLPVSEGNPIAPVSPYGYHKGIAEALLEEFSSVYGIRTAAARIFSAYGPGLRRQIMWDVCEKARMDSEVLLSGTGSETRDFVHAADVARAIGVIAEHAPMRAEAYNVGSGEETSIRVLAGALVEHVCPGKPVRFSGVQRPGDPKRWRADISAASVMGYSPRMSLTDGVASYCAWYDTARRG